MRKLDQNGIVSIIVSIIIMIILTLIAIAFAQIMRREQRQALDRQLSSQAYYAAESAINDAAFAITQAPNSISSSPNSCNVGSGALSKNVIDEVLAIEYSCVTVDSTPSELRYDSVRVDESVQVQLQPIDITGTPRKLGSLQISWRDTDGDPFSPGATTPLLELPQVADWGNKPGILRIEIIPLANSPDIGTRSELVARRKVFFLYPTSNGSGSVDWNTTQSGSVVRGDCSDTLSQRCDVEITDIFNNANNTNATYYVVRLRAIYDEIETTIDGVLASGGVSYFQGAQTEIDATGRSRDVLRRISARVAIEQRSQLPQYLQQSFDGVCKQLRLTDTGDAQYSCY